MTTSLFPMLLKQAREHCGWTQFALALQLGVTRVTVSRWESGVIVPSLHWRMKICELFDKPMDEWFPLAPSPSPTEEHGVLAGESLHLKRLAFQKKSLRYVIDIADTMIDVLDSQCDERTRSAALENLLGEYPKTDALPDAPTLAEVRIALKAAKEVASLPEQNLPMSAPEEVKQRFDHAKSAQELKVGGLADQEPQHILVALQGSHPETITFTLDLLLAKGFPLREVLVLCPGDMNSAKSSGPLFRLISDFTPNEHHLTESNPISLRLKLIGEITSEADADEALDVIRQTLHDFKKQRHHIHFLLSEEFALLSSLAFTEAMLNFDRYDHIWSLYIPDALRAQIYDRGLMHLPSDTAGIRLIEGPIPSLGAYITNSAQPFHRIQDGHHAQIGSSEYRRCKEVIGKVTKTQLTVLKAFARGLRPQQVAEALGIAFATVNTHKTALLGYCHNAWDIPESERLDYHFLCAKFASFFLLKDWETA